MISSTDSKARTTLNSMINVIMGKYCSAFMSEWNSLRFHPQTENLEPPCTALKKNTNTRRYCSVVFIWTVTLCIPANFLWFIGVTFLSWESEDVRRFPKMSDNFRRLSDLWPVNRCFDHLRLYGARLDEYDHVSVTFLTKIRDFAKVRSLFSRIGSSLFKYLKIFFQNESGKAVKWLTLFHQAWEMGTQAWVGVRSQFSIRRRDNHALGVTLDR